eukprot:CAMPEP_0201142596 /NCGR_PEP_ID=MMETSP0851-20130426/4247_1 /ASSEMBLY_ACC=CAM_ASM_000631 /TAXON_ID=183588 /ORGANISM="Pseudo-nitzschia fraudulenta, Strain WWA7" /LENGTH=214 /DNA_ID=CAMNT_0047416313 /DNA_START=77 /DNA_END=721 /DNA_ORIENTATION=+
MSNNIINTKRRKDSKKSVGFHPNVLVFNTKHLNDYTDDEIQRCWYDGREMSAIASDCLDIVSSIQENGHFISSPHYLRGLECRSRLGSAKRAENKFCGVDSVLEAQESQWESRQHDKDKIRNNYRVYSAPCHAEARRIGLEDEMHAMIVHHEENYSRNSTSKIKMSTRMPFDEMRSMNMKLQQMKFLVTPEETEAVGKIVNLPQTQNSLAGRAA